MLLSQARGGNDRTRNGEGKPVFMTSVVARFALSFSYFFVSIILGALANGSLYPLLFQAIYLVLVVPTVYARLSGIQLSR